ncbi:hypothetical protein KC19_3G137300 [Ceratodon purpureus]|uniref:Rieske domain-containing protein n=1 Tax=Ceratodon purpureus TaxID=3225 RepID=A0A8T0IKA6_CERPU|nr:hypothetical protein KC19_3G137300 [Ceratodon purpureus]
MAGVNVQAAVLSTRDTTIPNLDFQHSFCKQYGRSSADIRNSQEQKTFTRRSSHYKSNSLAATPTAWERNSVGSAKYRSVPHRRHVKVSAIAEPLTEPPQLESASKDDSKEAKFDWNKQWYPVAIIKDLEEDQPLAVTVIGRPLAVWWDKSSNKWQVYADKCPHRLAPLSEGSITQDGQLRCSYHGWTFKGDSGECTFIPQAPSDSKPHTSTKACVTVYPSIEQQGFLWFWPDLSQGAINIEAAANPPPFFPELNDPTYGFDMSVREVEYGYDTLVENLLDPAHFVNSHHKIQGRREDGGPWNLKLESKISAPGFKGMADFGPYDFTAPCTVTMNASYPPEISIRTNLYGDHSENLLVHALIVLLTSLKARLSKNPAPNIVATIFFCVPVSPGRSRCYWAFPRNFAAFTLKNVPQWIQHRMPNLVFDSDMLLLHVVERKLEQEGLSGYYAPTKADVLVLAFRKWLNTFAGGAPDWGRHFESNKLPPSPSKRMMLDRYQQHVKICKGCRTALGNFKALEFGLHVLAVALVGVVAASGAAPLPKLQPFSVPLVCGAVLSTVLARWLSHFIYKTFYFHDYNHAAVK